jgi:hypothetical protein
MRIKLLLYFIFLSYSPFVYSQNINQLKLGCSDLTVILENEEVINHFRLEKIKDFITFVDTFHLFDCSQLLVNDKEVVFSDKYTNEISKGDESFKQLKDQSNRFIVLQFVKRIKGKYILHLWQPNDNAFMEIILSKRKKVKIKIINTGVY